MAYFVIAGKPDCPEYVHAAHVASYLKERLPNFDLQLIQKRTGDWEPWLDHTNSKNHWYHTKSPIIWKTLTMRRGKPYLIGGLSEFWEYCYDYYTLESLIPKEELQKLVADNLEHFEKTENVQMEIRNIGIFGATNKMIVHLLPELLKIPELEMSSGLVVKLYDEDFDDKKYKFLKRLAEESKMLATTGYSDCVQVAESLAETITDCDLLIIIQDLSQKLSEDENQYFIRNMWLMYHLADKINAFAKKSLRIILAHQGSVSLTGTLLVEACTKIRLPNIVGISSDVGLCALNTISKKLGVPIEQMGAPPVWGFIGVHEFIDVEGVMQKCNIYKPYLRAINTNGGSTLPLGTVQSELRHVTYLIDDVDDILREIEISKEKTKETSERPFVLAKVRATVSLLKLWYSKKLPDEIISLAVFSNGSFGIPERVVFSQPVALNNNRMWTPFKSFPFPDNVKENIEKMFPYIEHLSQKFGLGNTTTISHITL